MTPDTQSSAQETMTLAEAISVLKANRPSDHQAMFSGVRDALDVVLPLAEQMLASSQVPVLPTTMIVEDVLHVFEVWRMRLPDTAFTHEDGVRFVAAIEAWASIAGLPVLPPPPRETGMVEKIAVEGYRAIHAGSEAIYAIRADAPDMAYRLARIAGSAVDRLQALLASSPSPERIRVSVASILAGEAKQRSALTRALADSEQRLAQLTQQVETEAGYRRVAWDSRQLLQDRLSVAERMRIELEAKVTNLEAALNDACATGDPVRAERDSLRDQLAAVKAANRSFALAFQEVAELKADLAHWHLCDEHQPSRWESDGTCPICEAHSGILTNSQYGPDTTAG